MHGDFFMTEVKPHSTEWFHIFETEAFKIKAALGQNYIAIHHVGSTAIAGLSSEPFIDIIVIPKDISLVASQLAPLGYNSKGELNIPFHEFLKKKEGNIKFHIHAYEEHSPEVDLNLTFRDYIKTHPIALNEYADLKKSLNTKNDFIQKALKDTNFDGLLFHTCAHDAEWEAYHRLKETLGSQAPEDFSYSPEDKNHIHFVLYKGTVIVTAAHIELLKAHEAALRSLATDTLYEGQGYSEYMMDQLEKWLKKKHITKLKVHTNPSTEAFYRKLGYIDMPLKEDVSKAHHSIDLGKTL
jgi:GrpB-like predicted nucleotidyltransferase (UPF0157 family)/N-acetylglutamate synthase-like GNAT family acetyltransferase